jgi:hypothetical protein
MRHALLAVVATVLAAGAALSVPTRPSDFARSDPVLAAGLRAP